jgi:hypothetical protein
MNKPLSERVQWEYNTGEVLSCSLGGFQVDIWPVHAGWVTRALYGTNVFLCQHMHSEDVFAAKLEALRIVQQAVITASAAWRD